MRIYLAQFNSTVGDLEDNTAKIISVIEEQKDADIVVFPELAITGYPPQDLIFNDTFVARNRVMLENIAAHVKNQYAIVGFIDSSESLNPQGWFKRFNGAALLHQGEIVHIFHKTLLPTYDVFDETRYFESSGDVEPYDIDVNGNKIRLGVEICEDLWDDAYKTKVTGILAIKGAELVINISASPYEKGKLPLRREILSIRAAQHNVTMAYCNLLGGQDELLFDGHCMVADANGNIIGACDAFAESGLAFSFDPINKKMEAINRPLTNEMEVLHQALITGIRDYVHKSGFTSVVLGLSGGVDSALVASLAVSALGAKNVLALMMPSQFSSRHSIDDAIKLTRNLGMPYHILSINETFKKYNEEFLPYFKDLPFGLAEENLQARIRGNYVMAFSNKFAKLALATGNKTEFALGYSTLYGDMCGALAPIGDLQKSLVYELCRFINSKGKKDTIPLNIINKKPSAELRPDQFDPFDYDIVSPLVDEIVENQVSAEDLVAKGYDSNLVHRTMNSVMSTEFKRRQGPPILKISNCAFGIGRRMPIVNRFRGNSEENGEKTRKNEA